ncbi:MAG: prepilin-type N-terminal cleavage/methylation domain-containing protein [Verrucomicrobia bacterium]|nr:prepilin-type N-terminal cleavage/methylation domain-containing protein [Verrucomicrobiota bacterium]
MKIFSAFHRSPAGCRRARSAAFTLIEAMVATALTTLVVGAGMVFMDFTSRSLAGITKQSELAIKASSVMEFVSARVRVATFVTNDANGLTLTLGFDDDVTVDSNGDGNKYNDTNHHEMFQFRNGDGSDVSVTDNVLIYKTNAGGTVTNYLIKEGVRKVYPATNIFSITNTGKLRPIVVIRYGLMDSYSGDRWQSIEVDSRVMRRN